MSNALNNHLCRTLDRGRIVQYWMSLFLIVTCLLISTETLARSKNQNSDIVLGMSTALTGPAADLGKNMRAGVLAQLKQVNRAGGIKGKRIRLISLDDGYEPSRTAPHMRRLIEQEHVLAVVGNVGTPTAIAAIPIANEKKTLLFAPFTGAGVLRKSPPDRYVINYRASYAEETGAMIDALIKIGKLHPEEIAFFTQRDGYGDAGFVGGMTALRRHGLKDPSIIKHVRYERNTVAVEDALASLLLSKPLPQAIIMVGAYAPCSKFISLAKESGLEAVFLNVSFVGSSSLARELGIQVDKVIVTQVVPHPRKSRLPLVKEYRSDLRAFNSSIGPTFGGLEGYTATRILVKALNNIKGPITHESIVDGLEKLGTFNIGLDDSLHLGPKDHQASHQIWPTILKEGTFVPFDWNDISSVMTKKS